MIFVVVVGMKVLVLVMVLVLVLVMMVVMVLMSRVSCLVSQIVAKSAHPEPCVAFQ